MKQHHIEAIIEVYQVAQAAHAAARAIARDHLELLPESLETEAIRAAIKQIEASTADIYCMLTVIRKR